MSEANTRAVVLRTHPYSESTVIARLLTEDFGVRSVIAKGARRPKSRFGVLLEPFTDGRIQVRFRDDRDLHTLAGFDVARSRQGIGRSLHAFAGASLLAEILLRTGTEDPHPELYSSVLACYDALAEGHPEPEAVVLGGIWSTLSVLGFGPRTDQCIRCGREIDAGEETGFDPQGGGVACSVCRPRGRRLNGTFRRELGALCGRGPVRGLDDAPLHRDLLRAHLIAQVDGDRPFRSLDLFLNSPA